MDHWGDPWADNANDKPPTKNAVTSPLPPAFAFNPVPVNGFVDDAGWGNNEDDGFSDWTSPNTGNIATTDVLSTPAENSDPSSAGWGTVTFEERGDVAPIWPESESSTPQGLLKVDSEPSDSSTVAHSDESVSQSEVGESIAQPQPDVESSVQSSTSPSETSRNELPIESPRTSVEDERAARKDATAPPHGAAGSDATSDDISGSFPEAEEDLIGSLEAIAAPERQTTPLEDTNDEPIHSTDGEEASSAHQSRTSTPNYASATDVAQSHTHPITAFCDQTLLAQLFPVSEGSDKQLEEHDDPIFSTAARKAWYRLTRKQTMREFNHGENDDNYIRVNWTNSRVRSDVHKTVARWAREDRISGTGPGARASFYWDTPAPAEFTAPFGHSRTQSSVPVTKTALPARQSLPPLATSSSAAFDWSSPASADSWKIDSPAVVSSSVPPALKNPTVAKLQRQEGRAASVDLTPRQSEQPAHKRTLTASHVTSGTSTVASPVSASPSHSPTKISDPWAGLDSFDNPSTSTVQVVDAPVDDDDDWGEMVQTPTLPTPQQLDPFSQPSTASAVLPPPPPFPATSLPTEASPPANTGEPMFPSPIVRLKSTISPTSALFKANAFVPLDAEQGPIGPGILKPANRAAQSPADKHLIIDIPGAAEAQKDDIAEDDIRKTAEIAIPSSPAPASITVEPEVNEVTEVVEETAAQSPVVAEPATPMQSSRDSWADADFSFFETAQPATGAQAPPQTHDPTDPFSFFDSAPPAVVPPVAKAVSQSPPRGSTPPRSQPPANATSSAERQRVAEDRMLQDILDGLPDLRYMLKR
ncbi:hypothetical protein E8E13_001173 [Curvularia kusanoi]|uniref:Uncharacterized protein n=1 Tax=Curvularia kusanoi TaxID=90978 RepID=A0A9P4T386_CURKU|nr:hypothetical protein E8E13_001173 [Curvularia kusanoi]